MFLPWGAAVWGGIAAIHGGGCEPNEDGVKHRLGWAAGMKTMSALHWLCECKTAAPHHLEVKRIYCDTFIGQRKAWMGANGLFNNEGVI